MKFVIGALVLLAVTNAWVRLAPSDPDRWHQILPNPESKRFANGEVRVLANSADRFAALNEIALRTDRTKQLTGALDDGAITFVTRSKVWGFPDYTTIWIDGDDLVLYARARFGLSDSGVNAARIANWLQQLSGT